MTTKMEHFPEKNPNPVLSAAKDGTVLYSNEAGELLLNEWRVAVGEKLPSNIGDIMQRILSLNSPEKMEVKAGNKVYLIVFHPLSEEECVNIYGFDISGQKELEEKLQIKEKQNDVLHQIGKIALEYDSLQTFLDESVKLIANTLRQDYCKIMELLPDGKFLMRAGTGWKSEFVGKQVVEGDIGSQAGYTLLSGMPVIVEDFGEEKRFNKPEILKVHGVASGASVIIGSKENIFGVLVVNSTKKRKFTSDDTYFLNSVAFLIAQVVKRKNAEESMRESEEKYRIVADNTYDWEFWLDSEGRFKYSSPSCERVTGYSAGEFINNPNLLQEIIYQDDRQSFLQHRHDILSSSHGGMEFRIVTKNGEIRWIHHLCQSLYDCEGGYVGSRGSNRDITERKEAEEALKKAHGSSETKVKERTSELEKAYELLKENEKILVDAQKMAQIGNWDWDIETDKAYWSNELYNIFGRNSQELAPSYTEYLSYVHPDDRENADRAHKEALNGKPFSMDHRIILSNGEERTIHIQTEVFFDEENGHVRLKGTVQDITERKKGEEKIQNLANIVESSLDAVGTISLDGIITSWNKGAERIYGYSKEEILGKHVSILTPSHLENETMKLIELIKQGKNVYQYETLRLGKDGKKIYVSLTYSPVFDTNGKLTAISILGRDITEIKRAEEALRNFEIARKQEIHHRIKNNLQVISSLLDLQAEKFICKEDIKDSEVLEAFKESQDRVISMALIHEELHRCGEGDTLNFSHYIKELADNLFLTYKLRNESISLDKDIEQDIFFDMDTGVPLGIIINELVSNSLKHAFPDRSAGEIRIKLHREEGDVKSFILTVSDNGVGIPENLDIEDLDSLGLQLVVSLVDQLDGELELKRDNGTEFTIRFTVTEEDIVAKNDFAYSGM
jgi:PAS domain S-box-containing protein